MWKHVTSTRFPFPASTFDNNNHFVFAFRHHSSHLIHPIASASLTHGHVPRCPDARPRSWEHTRGCSLDIGTCTAITCPQWTWSRAPTSASSTIQLSTTTNGLDLELVGQRRGQVRCFSTSLCTIYRTTTNTPGQDVARARPVRPYLVRATVVELWDQRIRAQGGSSGSGGELTTTRDNERVDVAKGVGGACTFLAACLLARLLASSQLTPRQCQALDVSERALDKPVTRHLVPFWTVTAVSDVGYKFRGQRSRQEYGNQRIPTRLYATLAAVGKDHWA